MPLKTKKGTKPQFLSDNKAVYGDAQRHVSCYLDTGGTQGQYEVIELRVYADDLPGERFRIHLTEDRLKPGPAMQTNPEITHGGYWWSYDDKFYGWVPKQAVLREEVKRVLDFCQV